MGHNHWQFSRKAQLVSKKQMQNDWIIPCAHVISTVRQIEDQSTGTSRIIRYHIHISTKSTAIRPTGDSDSSIT